MRRGLIWGVLGLAVLVAGCAGLAKRNEAEARQNYPPIGQFVDVDGTRVHAWVAGTGPDLVLIHGANGNLRDFTFDLAGRLTDRYRVTAFDRPGLGWTERLPGHGGAANTRAETPQEQAVLLQKAADRLGVRRPVVLGHSYGGAVALAWGLARPDETAALVLLAGASQPWEGDLGTLYDVTSTAVGGATVVPMITALAPESRVDSALESIFAPQPVPPGYAEYVGTGLSLRRVTLRANAQQVSALKPIIARMTQRYPDRLKMPIELVHGTADTTVPLDVHSEPLARQLPNAHLTRLEGVGHMPHHAAPRAVVSAIDRAASRAGLHPAR